MRNSTPRAIAWELLTEIRLERTALDAALAPLTPRHMTKAGVTRGGWSVKDVLAHLVEWQQDTDLVTLRRFAWTGPSWTLSDYLRASTAAHYLWARTRIRRWWRTQERGRTSRAR